MISNSPEVLNFNQLILKLNRFICNLLSVLPRQWPSDIKLGYGCNVCTGHHSFIAT